MEESKTDVREGATRRIMRQLKERINARQPINSPETTELYIDLSGEIDFVEDEPRKPEWYSNAINLIETVKRKQRKTLRRQQRNAAKTLRNGAVAVPAIEAAELSPGKLNINANGPSVATVVKRTIPREAALPHVVELPDPLPLERIEPTVNAIEPVPIELPVNDCTQLYDPCTREPISDIAALKKRIRNIEILNDITSVGKYGLTNTTSNYDFLTRVFMDKTVSLDDMVTFRLGVGGQIGSDIYEVLCRAFVFFGGIPGVNPKQDGNYKFVEKIEAAVPRVFDTPREAFENTMCKATSKSGVSDITLTYTSIDDAGRPRGITSTPYCETDCEPEGDTTIIKTYLISVKWYKKEKNAENYDIEKLKAVADILLQDEERKPYEIVVFLKSIDEFNRAHQRASRQFMRGIGKTYFGWDENVKPFLQTIRSQLFDEAERTSRSPSDVLVDRYFTEGAKPTLNLQLHQEIIVKSALNAIETCEDTLFVIGVLPRGGKTFIAGGIIRELIKTRSANLSRPLNILWLTAAPNETREQVRKELINKFEDFNNVEFINVVESDSRLRDIESTQHTLFFCSTQLLLKMKAPSVSASASAGTVKRSQMSAIMAQTGEIDLIFYDEAHKTATGDKTGDEINAIVSAYRSESLRLPFIFLTATYFNLLQEYNIRPENTFVWTYTDVLKSRGLATEFERDSAIANLKMRFNDKDTGIVSLILDRRQRNGETIQSMGTPYLDFPELMFISAEFQHEALERFERQGTFRPQGGFSLKTMFATRTEATLFDIRSTEHKKKIIVDADNVFVNKETLRTLVALITPGTEGFEDEEPGGEPFAQDATLLLEPSILGRINELSRSAKSRFRTDDFPSLLMFLPAQGDGSRIYFTMCAWAALLMKHPWWKQRYEVACVVDIPKTDDGDASAAAARGKRDTAPGVHLINGSDPKGAIFNLERKLHCSFPPKGIVILAGQKLSMGVSLPCTDVVFLLNDTKSPDDIIQKMYRGLTPSPGKTAAFVVDLNPTRTLAAVYGYTRVSNATANTSTEILKIIYDSYSWDADYFDLSVAKGSDARPLRFETHLRELFNKALSENNSEYQLKVNESKLESNLRKNIAAHFDSNPALMSTLTKPFGGERTDKEPIKLRFGASASIKSGRLIVRIPKHSNVTEENTAPESADVKEIVIDNIATTVSDFIHYLAIASKRTTFKDALLDYESRNPSFKRDVTHSIYQRENIKEKDIHPDILAEILITMVKTFFQRSERMFRDTKGRVDDSDVRRNAVLDIIHERLKPRKTQKKESGEVFTPIEFIKEMLSHLPVSIWSNHNLKWLDPANGIGNFPVVVFYKLDEGLKAWESNDIKRRKHIIENMLFMLELQSNNNRVAKKIFETLCKGCKANILTTNSLNITAEELSKSGFPNKYDVIIGNPPFNANGLLKGGGALWPKFVKLAFKLVAPNGYICFVHPPGWRKFYDIEDRDNQGKLWYTIRENGWNLDYINVSDRPPPHFPIVDYYVIHAKNTNIPTKYNSLFMGKSDAGETLLKFSFIPNMINDETMSILNKLFKAKGEPIHIIRNQSFQATESDKDKHGIPHYHFISKTGEKQFYNKEYSFIPEYIRKPKVIMTCKAGYEKGKLFAFYSEEHIGTTANSMYMLTTTKSQGNKLVAFLNSDIITFLLKITQYSAPPNHINELKLLNQLQLPDSLDYGLTASEEKLIKQIVGIKELVKGGGQRFTRKIRRK